jgi:hypothetical protein
VWAGLSGSADNAVINLIDGVPQTIAFKRNIGPDQSTTTSLVRVVPGLTTAETTDLDSFFATHAATRFFVDVDPNIMIGTLAMPRPLVRYANLLFTSCFPVGTQRGMRNATTGEATYPFVIPEVLQTGFVAQITVSHCPNYFGSTRYRTSATYILSMVRDWDPSFEGAPHIVNLLVMTPIAQGGNAEFGAPTATAYFQDTGGPERDAVSSPPTGFVVKWSDPVWGQYNNFPEITIQLLHAMLR